MNKNKTINKRTRAGALISKAATGAMCTLSAIAILWFLWSVADVVATNLDEAAQLNALNFFNVMNTLFN